MAQMLASNDPLRATWRKSLGADGIYDDLANELGLTTDEACVMDFCFLYFIWLHWAQFYSVTTDEDRQELDNLIRSFYGVKPMSVYLQRSPYLATLDPRWTEHIKTVTHAGP